MLLYYSLTVCNHVTSETNIMWNKARDVASRFSTCGGVDLVHVEVKVIVQHEVQ